MMRIAVVVSSLAALAAPPAPRAPSAGIDRMAWLQGCWEMASPGQTVEEHWMAPRGGTMIGTSRTVKGGKLMAHELVVLREQGERLAYEAHPSGQSSTVFLSREVGDGSALFENPAHDFPQAVGYRREGPDAVTAWIEGTPKGKTGKPRRIEYKFRRAACPGPAATGP